MYELSDPIIGQVT